MVVMVMMAQYIAATAASRTAHTPSQDTMSPTQNCQRAADTAQQRSERRPIGASSARDVLAQQPRARHAAGCAPDEATLRGAVARRDKS